MSAPSTSMTSGAARSAAVRVSAPLNFRVGKAGAAHGQLRVPKAPKGTLNFHLSMYYNDWLAVQVVPLQSMVGQPIVLRWPATNPTWISDPQTPTTLAPLTFRVPRLEVVDAIGSSVEINFTVNGVPATTPFTLIIKSQGADLPPPVFTAPNGPVSFTWPATGIDGSVQWQVNDTLWNSPVQRVQPGGQAQFVIPADILNASRGRLVRISYSINRANIERPLAFSHVLRLQL